ncbi:hypothetical protein HETIRDRAFT_477783 [Heterobasidion irregulare TC 32-1]|uniref:Secreted protein n=1 Tax=Heterobasidion irregulare (strain TC 32-1) TaxID=747525 RepID=W4JYA8_HETIT|nr:uncharacterized protein HETIRDRAFT_477783 [Heterobasidion irregulare TC 32-1]ETW78528.1 hypothetical protein HETIRDRAFT_477783 [Heterobasidion irregulare TC 32-1]
MIRLDVGLITIMFLPFYARSIVPTFNSTGTPVTCHATTLRSHTFRGRYELDRITLIHPNFLRTSLSPSEGVHFDRQQS